MLDWTGVTTDAVPPPPPKPSAFRFFANGCIAGIVLGMITMCVILYATAQVLSTMP
jgi:hypothetical protein